MVMKRTDMTRSYIPWTLGLPDTLRMMRCIESCAFEACLDERGVAADLCAGSHLYSPAYV